jgi:hypothetical protein
MTAELLMIVPTRGRPQNARDLYTSWMATVTGNSQLLFVVDDDDPQLESYRSQMAWMLNAQLLVGPRLRMVGSLNAAATSQGVEYEYVGFMGDDHRPRTLGWDSLFIEVLAKSPASIAYGNDLLQGEKMATAVVMTSDIISTLGYMAPPSLVHLCVDLCWNLWGERLGTLTYLDSVIIEHMHPANGKALDDVGYRDANSAERVSSDSAAFYAYRDGGQLDADVDKLRALL